MKKIIHSPLGLTLLAVAVITTGFFTYKAFFGTAPDKQYRLQAIENGDISQTVSANGTINPVTLVSVGTQVSGTVKKLYVDFNSKVEKGQVLLELDDALLLAQQNQSLANLQSAQASLELATANEARMRTLFTQEYVSHQEMDTAVQAKKTAEAQLKLAQATVQRDRANLAHSVIRSPVSGVVVDREVDVGQTVAASLQTPTLFKIAQDLSRMQIDANFAEADIGSIRVDQDVHFTVDAFPNRSFNGKVKEVRLNPTTQQNVVTYDVVINVDNPEKILLPGMTTYVNITIAGRKNVLLVPNAALRFKPTKSNLQKPVSNEANGAKTNADQPAGEGGTKKQKHKQDGFPGKVYVFEKGELRPVSVSLGITDNRNSEIIAGELKVGDQLVVGEAQGNGNSQSGSSPMRLRMF